MASDGLRVGLAIPFFPLAKAWARSWGGAWSFGARMWVFSNDDFKSRVLPGVGEALATQPTFQAEGLRDLAVDAWRNADRELFVSRLDAQLIPLEAGGHLFQSAYDSLVIRALKRLGAVFHGPAKAWEIQAPIDQALATLDEVAGLAEHLIYRHDQHVTLEDMTAPAGLDVGIAVTGAVPAPGVGRLQGIETGSGFITTVVDELARLQVDEALLVRSAEQFGLYDFQVDGVRHLLGATSALLGDDMGLGKSRQAVVAAHLAAGEGRVLIVCPASLRINWEREILAVLPGQLVAQVGEASPMDMTAARWHVCTYERLGRLVRDNTWRYVVMVVDEAHYLKEHDVNRTRNAFLMSQRIERRFLLTGTPVLNREGEIHTLLRISGHPVGLLPLPDFSRLYTGSQEARRRLGEQVASWMLRRKKDVLKNLPGKTYEVVYCEPPHGMERYRRILADPTMPALPKITALRQCLESLKIDYILERIRNLDQDDKVLVFCEYVATVDELVATLTAEGIGCVSLTGSDSTGKRQAAVDRFQGEAVARVFIGTSGAAGVGITLTAANVVMFAGLPWTPALKRQAEDRAWRNGQKRPVTVIIPLVPKTIDEDLYRLLEAKTGIENELIDASQDERAMMNAVMRSASAPAAIS
ncbi:DEAD/DEAH box helicase [Parasulfuritortus cantonensis]|uniref:DEAD/DEAH box helicase n=1 Tax=Parasulfuritortus cantonensis TaxID=2528202 RepID=A0A4V2NX74_9PROT|nr:DEAD/DEAH box helicase [Parasulfuritortus cantonensis]TCJ20152.1 DEAD/DEAH box helicase [Parasulfuritortus cantonensis]